MKTSLIYGLYLTLALLLLNLLFYFLGYHSDAEKYNSADMIGRICFWLFAFVFIILGTRARRSETPANEPFGYGRALFTGFQISLFAALFCIVTNVLYMRLINPGMVEIIIQAASAKAELKGATSTQIEQMEKGIRWAMGPIMSSVLVFFVILLCGSFVSLITSIFVRRPAQSELPPPVTV